MLTHENGTLSGSEGISSTAIGGGKGTAVLRYRLRIYFCEIRIPGGTGELWDYMLLYVREGVQTVTVNDTTYLVQKGRSLFLTAMRPTPITPRDTHLSSGFILTEPTRKNSANTILKKEELSFATAFWPGQSVTI